MIYHYLFSSLWTAAGLIGLLSRTWLLQKFLHDLAFGVEYGLNGMRKLVVHRAVENCILHLCIELGIVCVGLSALFGPITNSSTNRTELILTSLLVLIPVFLASDAIRACMFQKRMLRN